jgi:DNA replication protein DnaC
MSAEIIEQGLKDLHLPAMRQIFRETASRALEEQLSFVEYLGLLVERELEERKQRSVERRLDESRLPLGKSHENFEFKRIPLKLQRQLKVLMDGDFIRRRENLLIFGNPGSGKTHLLCAVGQELVRKWGMKVLFLPSARLLQDLLVAKRDLVLPRAFKRLMSYDALIIDDIGYVQQNKDEVEVLFTLISECYEKTSILLTSNLPFSQWEKIFKDPMMTIAAIDRLVHHSVVLEMNLPSYRMENSSSRREASETN